MFGYEGIFVTGLFKLTIALLGIIMGRVTLFWFDRYMVQHKFTVWLEKADDQAKATYYAGRFIAVAVIIGFALS